MELKYHEDSLKYALDGDYWMFDSIEIITNDIEFKFDAQKYSHAYLNQFGYLNMKADGFEGIVDYKNADILVSDTEVSIKTKDTLVCFKFAKEHVKDSSGMLEFIETYKSYTNR